MKPLAQQVWREPAAAIGLLTTLALLVINLIGTPDCSAQGLIAIFAPFASSLGIRQLVTPAQTKDEEPK